MSKERIDTGKNPQIIVDCHGDLKIRGWNEPVIQISGGPYETSENKVGLMIHGDGDLNLMVPDGSILEVSSAKGDLAIKNFSGNVALQEIMGDAVLRNLGTVDLHSVHADVSCRNLDGPLSIGEVMGDLVLRNVVELKADGVHGDLAAKNISGDTLIGEVMGDIVLNSVDGSVSIAKGHGDVNLSKLSGINTVSSALGDIRIRGELVPGKHSFSANADIVVRWPVDSPVIIDATASKIKNMLKLENLIEEENHLSGQIGDGQTFLNLEAKGRILLKDMVSTSDPWKYFNDGDSDWSVDLDGLGEHIATEISTRMGEWSSQMEKRLGPEFMAKIEQKTREAAQRAEKAAEKAIRKAERAANKAQWRMEKRSTRGQSRQSSRSAPREKKKATEEEQLKILRMVEKGIISPEEAGTLLETLES